MAAKTNALSEEKLRKRESMEERKAGVTECVTLVKHSLFSVYYQNRWPVADLRQIINRLYMLLQERCVVVLLEKKDIGYVILYHTCLDPFWKDHFEDYIKNTLYKEIILQEHTLEDLIILDKDKVKSFGIGTINNKHPININEYLIKFHENKYFMIHEMYSPRDTNPEAKGKRTFPPIRIRKNQYLFYLKKTLSDDKNNPVDPIIDRIFSDEKLNKVISGKAKFWEKQKLIRESPQPHLLKLHWEFLDDKFRENHAQRINEIFNQEYISLKDSPLLKNNRKTPNIIFFIREFLQQELRYRRNPDEERYYPYRVRILIPEAQKDDLRNGFEELRDKLTASKREGNMADFNKFYNIENVNTGFFWELLEKENGIDEILDFIEKPNQLFARSMSDSSFESGYVNIKEGPFTFGGISRLETKELEKGIESEGYRRSICVHYAFTIMSSQINEPSVNKIFQILTVPGAVGGSPLFCAGFVYPLIKKEDKSKFPRNYHRIWLNNYHFYHAICHYLIFNIRTKIMNLYIEQVRNIYENDQNHILENIAANIPFNKKDILELLNPKFHTLCRIYPCGLIQFDEMPNDQLMINNIKTPYFKIYYAGGNFPLAVYVHENPFFLNLTANGNFLETERIVESLREANNHLKQKLITKIKENRQSNTKLH